MFALRRNNRLPPPLFSGTVCLCPKPGPTAKLRIRDATAILQKTDSETNARNTDDGRLLAGTERRMLRVGLILTGLMLAGLGIGWVLFPDSTLRFAAMTGLNLLIGRAAGMSFGYASGLGHAQVIPANVIVETIQVLVIYPLFVLSWHQLLDMPRLRPFLARMQGTAEARRGMVTKFGILGLFVFVFIPFWMTGPVVGSILGFLLGLRPAINIAVVLIATYAAIGMWALLLNEFSAWAATWNRFAPYALVVALVLIALGGYFMRWRQTRFSNRRA